MNYQKKLDSVIEEISKNDKLPKLLLHACCAPCSSYVIEYLSNYFDITLYFYNPNMDSKEEFDRRAAEIVKFIDSFKPTNPVNYVIENYDSSEFDEAIKSYEDDVEGTSRCFICYRLRLEAAGKYAKENNFDYFTTTLSISPYKNSNKLNEIGLELEEAIGIKYLVADFKKKNGYKRSIELSNEYGLYRQDYCGCKYSKMARDKRETLKDEEVFVKLESPKEKEETLKKDIANLYETYYNKTVVKNKKKDKDPEMFKFHDIKRRDTSKFSLFKFIWGIIKLLLIVSLITLGTYLVFKKVVKKTEPEVLINTEKTSADISKLYIYGNHLNLLGSLELGETVPTSMSLVLISASNTLEYDLKYEIAKNNVVSFDLAKVLNDGVVLDDITINNYVMFIEVKTADASLYYPIKNNSGYDKTTYYGISDNDITKKFVIDNETKYSSMSINISKSSDEVYDIIIDPGHGGEDSGACFDDNNDICETDYTLMLSKLLKSDLEKAGFKVAITRTEDVWTDKYGDDGRVTQGYESNAKMLLSIHMNSSEVSSNGFELYTPNNINYVFSERLVNNLNRVGGLTYSTNTSKKVENGIYTRTLDSSDLANMSKDATEKSYTPYSVTLATNYYFMIRETGGFMTGAYIDGRDGKEANPYVKSNRGLESYILEIGYITSSSDLSNIDTNKNAYMQSISDTITSYYNK